MSDNALTVRIFGTVVSTYTRIVQIACEEAGLGHETIATAAHDPANRHPFGKVPVVEVDGLELYETVAITQYIDNAHHGSALQPRDPIRRARMDRWVAVANNYLFPLFEHSLVMPYVMHRFAGYPLDRDKIERGSPGVSRALGFCEAEWQRDGAWRGAEPDGFDLADVFLYPILRSVQLTPQGKAGLDQCEAVSRWLAATGKRASIVATLWPGEEA